MLLGMPGIPPVTERDVFEMTRKTYDVIKELWPDNGIPSEKGLATAMSMADVPANFPADRIADWSLVREAAKSR